MKPPTAPKLMGQGKLALAIEQTFIQEMEALSLVLKDRGSRMKGTCMEGVAVLRFFVCFAL